MVSHFLEALLLRGLGMKILTRVHVYVMHAGAGILLGILDVLASFLDENK